MAAQCAGAVDLPVGVGLFVLNVEIPARRWSESVALVIILHGQPIECGIMVLSLRNSLLPAVPSLVVAAARVLYARRAQDAILRRRDAVLRQNVMRATAGQYRPVA